MIDIAIEYPSMLTLRTAVGKSPSEWAELTQDQFLAVFRLISGKEQNLRFLSIMTGIGLNIVNKLSSYQIFKLTEQINFTERVGLCHSDFFIWELSKKNEIFQAPRHKMSDVTFGQFIFMFTHYNDWFMFGNETSLNKFIACTYLKDSEKFSEDIPIKREKQFAYLSLEIRKAIGFNFLLILFWLQSSYPLIFKGPGNVTIEPGESKNQVSSEWMNIYKSMATDNLIDRAKYEDQSIHVVLRDITRRYKQNLIKNTLN